MPRAGVGWIPRDAKAGPEPLLLPLLSGVPPPPAAPCPTFPTGRVSPCTDLEACDGPGLQVRLDVAGVEVGDAHQEARPRERPQLAEAEAGMLWERMDTAGNGLIPPLTPQIRLSLSLKPILNSAGL